MPNRTKSGLTVFASLIVCGLSFSRPALSGGQIVSVTDENGRKVFINAGEVRVTGVIGRNTSPAKASGATIPTPEINDLVAQTASRHQIDPQLIHAIIKVESQYDPKAVSNKGAMGLMQLIPGTAQRFGVENPFNPKENIEGGVSYLKHLLGLFGGDLSLSLAAYNAGEGAVQRFGGVPSFAETQNYVRKVTDLYQSSSPQLGTTAAGNQPPASPILRFVDEQGLVHYSNVE